MAKTTGKFGRVDYFDYDSDEAREEMQKLRDEFDGALKLMAEDPEWPSSIYASADAGPAMPKLPSEVWAASRAAASARAAPRPGWADVLGDGSLLKRSTAATAAAGGARRAAWGDVATVRGSARSASRGAPFWATAAGATAEFVVGGAAVPRCWSEAAATLAVGERADFEVAASLAFGDARFDDVARAAMADAASSGFAHGVDADEAVALDVELVAVRPSGCVDASGALGAGAVLKWTRDAGAGWRTPGARCDVVYERTPLTFRTWAWPGAAAAPGPGDVDDLEAGDAARLESPRVANPSESSRRGAAVDGVRAALETMVPGETAYVATRGGDLCLVTLVSFVEHEDCFPERPGAVLKRTLRRPGDDAGPLPFPRDLDVVAVRGVVRRAGGGPVACCYGSAVAAPGAPGGEAAAWALDEDARATFCSSPLVAAPLCRGVELGVRRMVVGEVAEIAIEAPDLGFVRPPSAAAPPTAPRLADIDAFHYGGPGGALGAVADPACYSAGLVATLELVSVARRGAGLLRGCGGGGDPLARCAAALEAAEELKALGGAHYKAGAFARAARRYTAAIAAAGDAGDALALDPLAHAHDPEAAGRVAYDAAVEDAPERGPTALQARRADAEARLAALYRDCRLNRAAADLKRCAHDRVCEDCHAVLQVDEGNLKALYRGGRALVALKDHDGARSLFRRCLDVDDACDDAKRGLRDLDRLAAKDPAKAFKGAFGPQRGLAGGAFGASGRPKPAPVAHDRPAEDQAKPKRAAAGAPASKRARAADVS